MQRLVEGAGDFGRKIELFRHQSSKSAPGGANVTLLTRWKAGSTPLAPTVAVVSTSLKEGRYTCLLIVTLAGLALWCCNRGA
jgi:hypothetical protein